MLLLSLPLAASQISSLTQLKNVNDITQDSQGFIWLTGQQGVTRYDGKQFINFAHHSKSWHVPYIWTHDIDVIGEQLLVSTENNGLWLLNSQTGESQAVDARISGDTVYNASYFNQQYYLYGVVPRTLYRYDPKTSSTHVIQRNIEITQLIHTSTSLYLYNRMGLFEIKNDVVSPILMEPIKAATSKGELLVVASKETLYVYKNNQQIASKPLNEKVTNIAFEHNLQGSSENFYLINDQNKISKYSPELTSLAHRYYTDQQVQTKKLFHDSSNTLWLVTSLGLNRLSPANVKNNEKTYKAAINAIDVEVFNDQIIIGSYGAGLHQLNDDASLIPSDINQKITKDGKIITDMQTIQDSLYLATFDGLWRYHFPTKILEKLNFKNNNKILLKLIQRDKQLYVATDENGFFIYDLLKQKVTTIVDEHSGLSTGEIIDILPLSDNSIWLATAKGVDIYHPNQSITHLDLTGSSKAVSLTEANNKIYVTTKGDGIFVYSKEQELLSRFAIGINFGTARLIQGEIWAPSRNGVYRISPEDNQIIMEPGSESYSFSSEPILHKNDIILGHYGGVVELPLTQQQHHHAKVYVSKTTVSGQSYLLNKAVKNASSNDVITLDLSSLDYRSGHEKQFKYQINGQEWHDVNGHQITLTGLASGDYHLTIMGTNSMGQWSNFKAFSNIEIAYPWYWTPQIRIFYALLTLGFFVLISWLLYLRGKSISHIHALLSQESINAGKINLNIRRRLSHAIDLCEQAKEGEQEITAQIKQALLNSVEELKQQTQDKEPSHLNERPLHVALPYLFTFLTQKYHVKVHHHLDFSEESIPDQVCSDVYKIAYEALTSAILNGDSHNFSLAIKQHQDKLWLTISDDGSSFLKFSSKINFDISMYYIRQIASKYNASVNTFSEQPCGSQLVISLPLTLLNK